MMKGVLVLFNLFIVLWKESLVFLVLVIIFVVELGSVVFNMLVVIVKKML